MTKDFNACLNDLLREVAPQLRGGFEELYIDFARDTDTLRASFVDPDGAEVPLDAPPTMREALWALLTVQFPDKRGRPVDRCTIEIENGGDVQIDARFVDAPREATGA